MELQKIERVRLETGQVYSGWGYFENKNFIPQGCGKKYYDGYYAYGNFRHGILDGPTIVSHDYYMNICHFKNNRGNGWGLCINQGDLIEFGFNENSLLKVNLVDLVLWYFTKMRMSDRRNETLLHMYTCKDTKEVSELLIGYPGTSPINGVGDCCMGFRFKADGSVWVGSINDRKLSGNLIHFRPDGLIDAGFFEDSELLGREDLQSIIDGYYGIYNDKDNLLGDYLFQRKKSSQYIEKERIRNTFKDIAEITVGYNYFVDSQQQIDSKILNKNSYKMSYYVSEVAFNGGDNFQSFNEETWVVGDKTIITPHGNLQIEDTTLLEQGTLVGIQFQVNGTFRMNEFSCSNGFENDAEIKTLALMRQPNNAWLWAYAFDEDDMPIANFCGHDDLDGLASYVSILESYSKL